MVTSAILPLVDGNINLEQWLAEIEARFTPAEVAQIRNACVFIQTNFDTIKTPLRLSCISLGLEIANTILRLNPDADTVVAAILYPACQYADLTDEDLQNSGYNPTVTKLLHAALQMDLIGDLQGKAVSNNRMDNYRRMLLSMVDDIRIVLLKLAERIVFMRHIDELVRLEQQKISRQTLDIYAPLANRLGIFELKWELEDLSFQILQPNEYLTIAKKLKERRLDREKFITDFINELNELLIEHKVKGAITGRAKHIYSIYKKMTRKQLAYESLYDLLALRILVDNITDCYTALGLIHTYWPHIKSEFVDYVATPKPNGYQSIHTVITTPDQRRIEIQIRTHGMHEKSELGAAAHWMYKEGGHMIAKDESYQRKIARLRELLEWQQEMVDTADIPAQIAHGLIEDHIYVFSPHDEVIALPVGSTPLDYAYQIHSEIGHKCRGAKINGRMVPLTHVLQTGDRVDILTGKEAAPSRDWLNPQLGYLTSTRAKAKIHAWFKKRDFDANVIEGQGILQRELKKHGLTHITANQLMTRFHVQTAEEFLAAIGCGDIRVPQLTGALQDLLNEKAAEKPVPELVKPKKTSKTPKSILVDGLENLLTQIAHCCKPLPGEDIIGYVTVNRGVSVHRTNCTNLAELTKQHPERILPVSWGTIGKANYQVDLTLEAANRSDLLRDITKTLSDEAIAILGLNSYIEPNHNVMVVNIHLELNSITQYQQVQHRLQSISGVFSIKRQ